MRKLYVAAVTCALILGLGTQARAESNGDSVSKLLRLNNQLTSTLEAYATDASVCKAINFAALANETNAAIEAGLAEGSEEAAFNAEEAGKGLKLLMKRCGVSA